MSTSSLHLVLSAFLLLLFIVSHAAKNNNHQMSNSKLFLIGGNLDDNNNHIFDAMWQKTPQLLSSHNSTRKLIQIAVVTAASGDPDSPQYYADLFQQKSDEQYEIKTVWVPIDLDHIDNNKNPKVIELLNQVNMVFFSGGDQSRLVTCFCEKKGPDGALQVDSPFLARLRQLFNEGSVLVAGTSAGTAIQAPKPAMITGGESWEAVVYGAFEDGSPDIRSSYLSYDAQGGFGLFTLGLVDTHFSERGRQGRLIRLADHVNSPLAFGIDENTALYVESSMSEQQHKGIEVAHLTVYGNNGVHMFNLTGHRSSPDRDNYWKTSMVQDSYFTREDELVISMDHVSGATLKYVKFAPWKSSLWGREQPRSPQESKDIFSSPDDDVDDKRRYPREFTIVAQSLVDSRYGNYSFSTTFESNPTYTVGMQRIDSTAIKTKAVQGYDDAKKSYISYDYVLVDIWREEQN